MEGNLCGSGRDAGSVGLHIALAAGSVVFSAPHSVGRGDVAEIQMVAAAIGCILYGEVECVIGAGIVEYGRESILVVVGSRVVRAKSQSNAIRVENA